MRHGPPTISSTGQRAVRRLVALGAAVAIMILSGAAALLFVGSAELDQLQAREDRALVTAALGRSEVRIASDLTTATGWDQGYRMLRPGGDVAWADAEIGSYFAHNRGHDRSVVIDGRDVPFHAWVRGRRQPPESQARFARAAEPLVRRVRALETARGRIAPKAPPSDPSLAETAWGLVVADGQIYLAAASTVTPATSETPRGAEPGVVVISAQQIESQLGVLRQLNIRNPRIEAGAPRSPTSVGLVDIDGRIVGSIAWEPEHPGLKVLRDAAPALIMGFLATAVAGAWFAWHVRRVVRQLGRHEAGHRAALAELVEARDRAESASVAKSRFLANMSHEIRTPLNGILGMAQVLARGAIEPSQREQVKVIRTSGETLLALLNDLLDLSKIEAGRVELDTHDFDLEEAVAAATRSFAALAAQKGVRFMVEVEEAARGVWRGDGGRITQVLSNLSSNAVKFTAEGEIRVCVRRTDEGLACTVSDTGAGIPRARLALLFQRFSQVDPSTTRRFGGTGLGLAICRELVELMGGTIRVTSVEGRGSAFGFELPLLWSSAPECETPPREAAELPPLRVLGAEDNKINQLLLTALLEPMGVDLSFAADGVEAVARFQAERFDLVLMDIQMPAMNGVDATRAIRAYEAERGLAATPILAVSANVMRHQVDEYLAAGMNSFVAKPIDAGLLMGAIEDALAGAGGQTSAVG